MSSPPAASNHAPIQDVQGRSDTRRVRIDRVGVRNVVYPIRLIVPARPDPRHPGTPGTASEQTTVANIAMYVSLPETQKGTHMSRFIEVLNEHDKAISPDDIPDITRAIARRLHARDAHFECSFTYFIRKFAPVTLQPGLMDYKVAFECTTSHDPATGKDHTDLIMSVSAPATSLCPCSKEISSYGAHNQRCEIIARVRSRPGVRTLWIEDLVQILEQAASCGVYSVLKRPDEKHVTEAAYDNPKFVEDIIRDLALGLDAEDRVAWYSISSENFESIHNHNAYAELSRQKSPSSTPLGVAV